MPRPDLSALEESAKARLAEARQLQARAEARAPVVDRVHDMTRKLRQRNRWGALIEDVMMGGR